MLKYPCLVLDHDDTVMDSTTHVHHPAFLVSLAVIRLLMNYIRKHGFELFGYYRIALGLIILVYFL